MKVKLPADVVHSLNQLKKTSSNLKIMRHIWNKNANSRIRIIQEYIVVNGETGINNLMRALLDGYEVEEIEEEI